MRTHFERLVSERVVIAVIIVNTLAIFLRAFPSWRAQYEGPLFAVDYVCTVFFVIELVIKARLLGVRAYLSSGWNRFDLAVVLLSTPLLLSPMLDLADFGVILLLRLGRVLRFFRLLRFVPDSDRLWAGVGRGVKASLGVLLALSLYNFALGLAACYLFGELDPVHFGDPVRAVYALFKVFTVEGWYEIPDALSAQAASPVVAWGIRAFFVGAVATGGILGLSMANAVFVDEMVMDNNLELEQEMERISGALATLQERADTLLADNAALRAEQAEQLDRIEALLQARAPTPADE